MPYTLTRQCYFASDQPYVVEISHGDLDSTGSDAYAKHYKGEFETLQDPREAVDVALAIATAWKKDKPELDIHIAHGFTAGSTLQLEPESEDWEENVAALKKWAAEAWEKLPKCSCGEPLPEERKQYTLCEPYDDMDEAYCSERCAEKAYEFYCQEDAKLQADLDNNPNAHEEPSHDDC